MDDRISELPNCILSNILAMLSIKDLLKTSILSKRWCNLWALRRDLYFDIFNVLGSSEEELLQSQYLIEVLNTSTISPGVIFYGVPTKEKHVNLDMSRDEFVKRVDGFVKNFQGTKIDSFIVSFYLDCEQSSAINPWISFAIARRVERIDLLFLGRPYVLPINKCKRYEFDFDLFSETNASTLKHLRLENCLVCHPIKCDFIPLKNLRSLSLEEVRLEETFIESLLSKCPRLEELSLIFCEFKSSVPEIVSSSLCHLKVLGCYLVCNNNYLWRLNLNYVDCLKLTSLELGCLQLTPSEDGLDTLNFNTPGLKIIEFSISSEQELNTLVATCATFFPQLEIMHVTAIFSMVTTSVNITQKLNHLKEFILFISIDSDLLDDVEYNPLWILNMLQVCPLLQKLSVMFAYPEFLDNQKDIIRDVETFFHDEVKIIELGGCVGNWFEIEFVMNVLKYCPKLQQIVVGPYWRESDTLDWNSNDVWFQSGRGRMREKLQDKEIIGLEKLVLI